MPTERLCASVSRMGGERDVSQARVASPHGRRYVPPNSAKTTLSVALAGTKKRSYAKSSLLTSSDCNPDIELYYAGDLSLLRERCVAVVGARRATIEGKERAATFAAKLAKAGFVVVSGLAKGVDTVALKQAIASGGRVIGVIGTPLDRVYPAENSALQEEIYRHHLLISQFPSGTRVYRSNFPKRNRLMALLSNATIVVEASDTSGSLHQAVECSKLGRLLYITRALANDDKLKWPKRFIGKPGTFVIDDTKAAEMRLFA